MSWLSNYHSLYMVLLAALATIGYMVGRWRRSGELCPRCQQDLKQAAALKSRADGLQKT